MTVRKFLCAGMTFAAALLCNSTATAQTTYKEVNIATPNAASLGKQVDVPVSYHTGMPQIGLPIYTVSEGPLSLPIGLSYHPGGVKVAEPASWVGAGWSLQAGGVINRTVAGQPDERTGQGNGVQTHGHLSDNGYNNYLVPNGATQTDDAAFRDGRKDGEPDLYFFNFAGYGGKFYFHDDGTPVLVPQQDIKIEAQYPGTGSISGFTITTPDGTRYYFGQTPATNDVDPVEVSNPYSSSVGMINSQLISAWYLYKVESPEADFSITLRYVEEKYGFHTLSSFPKRDNDPETDKEYNVVKTHVKGVRLAEINFSQGRVVFDASLTRADLCRYSQPQDLDDVANTEAKALTGISITNGTTLCRRFVLSYGYFEDNISSLATGITQIAGGYNINTDRKRLKLLQVQEQSCGSTTVLDVPPTVFDYHTELVPRRLSLGSDFWGFINGANSNQKMIATYTVNKYTTLAGASRDPNWPAMRGGALKKIIYPTGGSTDFEFEPNRVWLSFLKYNAEQRYSFSTGYDGNQNGTSHTGTYTSNAYKCVVSNSGGGDASITSLGLQVPPGQTKEVVWTPGAGNTTLFLFKQNASTGNGATATIYEMVPVQYQNNEVVGGLRIKTVTQTDGVNASPMVTSYSYDVNGQSSGKLYGRPVVAQVIRNDFFKSEYGGFSNGACSPDGCLACGTTPAYYKSGGSVRAMENTQGNHIGYNEVRVEKTGNGYSIYRYYGSNVWENDVSDIAVRNVDLQCNANIPNYPPAPLAFEPKRGDLKYEGHFNSSGQMITEKDYLYTYTENPVKTPGYLTERILLGGSNIITLYELNTFKKTQATVMERLRDPASGNTLQTSSTTDYASDFHTQPTRTSTSNSTAVPLETKLKYAYDYRVPAADAVAACYPPYVSACSTAAGNYYAARAACGNDLCKRTALINYRMALATARKNYLACRQTGFTNTNSSFNTAFNNALAAADAELKPVLEMNKRGRNLLIENSAFKNSLLASAVFNKYVITPYSTKSAIEISKEQKISVATPATGFAPSAVSGNTISKDSRYKDEALITMNRENLQQLKKPGGVNTAYLWNDSYNQTLAVVANADAADIAFTSFEPQAAGGFSFDAGAATTSSKITGSRGLSFSGGPVTKTGLNAAKIYVVSYWVNYNTGSLLVNGGSGQLMRSLPNGWQQYQHSVTGSTSVSISGTGIIDELRLHPKGALMTTYTYVPLVGLSSQCDANNRISFYEYDALGRLGIIRDLEGNIVKKICYRYNGQAENCVTSNVANPFYSAAVTRIYCRNNCPANNLPGCDWFTVPAAMFTSLISQADADAQAVAYADASGQVWINTNGTCTPCTGVDKKIVNGACETGVKVVTVSYYDEGIWHCVFHYEFSDYSQTQDFTTDGPDPCE
jgi:hypothetical protein